MRRSPFLPTPALPLARKVRLRLSPHFPCRRQPYGLEQNRSVPPALPAAWGSSVKSIAVGHANVAVPDPLPSVAPCGTALLAESGRCLQVFATVRTPQAAVSFSSRGTPVPGSPGPRASSFRRPSPCYAMPRPSSASSTRPTLPPKLACRQRSTRPASPDARRRRRIGADLEDEDRAKPALDAIAHQVDAFSTSTTAATIAATGPGSGLTAGTRPFRTIGRKTVIEDRAQRP